MVASMYSSVICKLLVLFETLLEPCAEAESCLSVWPEDEPPLAPTAANPNETAPPPVVEEDLFIQSNCPCERALSAVYCCTVFDLTSSDCQPSSSLSGS